MYKKLLIIGLVCLVGTVGYLVFQFMGQDGGASGSPSFTTQQLRRGSPARKAAKPFMFHAKKVDTEQSR